MKYPRKVNEDRFEHYKKIVIEKIILMASDGTDLEKVMSNRSLRVYVGHMLTYARALEEDNDK